MSNHKHFQLPFSYLNFQILMLNILLLPFSLFTLSSTSVSLFYSFHSLAISITKHVYPLNNRVDIQTIILNRFELDASGNNNEQKVRSKEEMGNVKK